MYIGILLGAHPILHISRIMVNLQFQILMLPEKYLRDFEAVTFQQG
jgi:hypothetical protein